MNQVAKSAPPPPRIIEIRQYFVDRSDELKAALGEIPVETFIRAIVTSLQINPDLLECRTKSLWLAAMRACRDQLLPDGIEAALVPYKDQCNYMPMYQGMVRRFRRSGQFKWITANVVREGEEFYHFIDETGEHFRHVPGDDDDSPVTKAYAMAITKDGAAFVAVLSAAMLQRIRVFSKARKEDAPWNVWPEEMQKKSAIRRLSKLLPSVRDLMPGEDDEPLPPVLAPPVAPGAPTALPPRRTPQRMLEQFAEESAQRPADAIDGLDTVDATEQQADVGGGGPIPSAAPASKPRPTDDDPPAEAAGGGAAATTGAPASVDTAGAVDPIRIAYRRGQDWKTRGNGRKAVPPEYRGPDRQREAIAWTAGYDGSALPTWQDDEAAP